jgi:hypothetical protein
VKPRNRVHLSVEECRRLLGSCPALSDSEVERLRDAMYALAYVAVDALESARRGSSTGDVAGMAKEALSSPRGAGLRHDAEITPHRPRRPRLVAVSGDTPMENL